MTHSELRRDVQQLADQLVDLVRRQDYDTLATTVPRVVGKQGAEAHLFTPVLLALASEAAARIRAATDVHPQDIFTVGLEMDAEHGLSVDDLDPPLRASLRAVLSELHDDRENTLVQLGFITRDDDSLGRLDALLHLVSWVSDLR
jgi:hypothetical protein